jgi:phosphotriesterase-related protein
MSVSQINDSQLSASRFVETVSGKVPADCLGVTLAHEHLAMRPGDPLQYEESILDEPEKMVQEVSVYATAGGGSIVEMSPLNFGRNVAACQAISQATGVHVICATGFHNEKFLPDWAYTWSEAQLVALLLSELEQGIDGSLVKPGVIKIGTSYMEIKPIEVKLIAAAAKAHIKSGVPISTHCDKGSMALEQCQHFLRYGADPGRVILGHVDIPNDAEYLKRICALGFNVGIDHVGRDLHNKDQVKIRLIQELIAAGYIDHIFLSGDMGKKSYLSVYGGAPGLGYILCELKQYLRESGISEEELRHILVENPRRVFSSPFEC